MSKKRIEEIIKNVDEWKEKYYSQYREVVEQRKKVGKMRKPIKGTNETVEMNVVEKRLPDFKFFDSWLEYEELEVKSKKEFSEGKHKKYEVLTKESFDNLFFKFEVKRVRMFSEFTEGKIVKDKTGKVVQVPFVFAKDTIYVNDEYSMEDWKDSSIVISLVIAQVMQRMYDNFYNKPLGSTRFKSDMVIWLSSFGFLDKREDEEKYPEPMFQLSGRGLFYQYMKGHYLGTDMDFDFIDKIDWMLYKHLVMYFSSGEYAYLRGYTYGYRDIYEMKDQASGSFILEIDVWEVEWRIGEQIIDLNNVGSRERSKRTKLRTFGDVREGEVVVDKTKSVLDKKFGRKDVILNTLDGLV